VEKTVENAGFQRQTADKRPFLLIVFEAKGLQRHRFQPFQPDVTLVPRL
jgi:hypothetical protein